MANDSHNIYKGREGERESRTGSISLHAILPIVKNVTHTEITRTSLLYYK